MLAIVSLIVLLLAGPAFAQDDVDERALLRLTGPPPLGLPEPPLPGEVPTANQIALGRKLFFDRRLSVNNTMSCGMCHIPEQGFTNNELKTPVGVEGRTVRRNAPTIVNAAYLKRVFHDGRVPSLELQALKPLTEHNEMANPSLGHVIETIKRTDDYPARFERAFGGGPTAERMALAIAAWERTLVAGDSAFDRWKYGGERDALTAQQRYGFELFTGRALCVSCHHIGEQDALFTDDDFHDTGIGYRRNEIAPREKTPIPVEIAPGVVIGVDRDFMEVISEPATTDLGRHEVTGEEGDMYRFKTPSLRNVALTAPYMHDGSLRTLEDVVRFYNDGGIPHDGIDPLIRPLALTDEEVLALVSFLESLTSPAIGELTDDARSTPVGD